VIVTTGERGGGRTAGHSAGKNVRSPEREEATQNFQEKKRWFFFYHYWADQYRITSVVPRAESERRKRKGEKFRKERSGGNQRINLKK